MSNQTPTWKIIVLGDKEVGKTSLINRYVYNTFDVITNNSSGTFIRKIVKCKNGSINALITEVHMNTFSQDKILGSKIAILVSDLTRYETLDIIDEMAKKIKKISPKTKIVIIANKLDLKYNAKFWVEDIKKIVKEIDAFTFGIVSAKTGENLFEGIEILCDKVLEADAKSQNSH